METRMKILRRTAWLFLLTINSFAILYGIFMYEDEKRKLSICFVLGANLISTSIHLIKKW